MYKLCNLKVWWFWGDMSLSCFYKDHTVQHALQEAWCCSCGLRLSDSINRPKSHTV